MRTVKIYILVAIIFLNISNTVFSQISFDDYEKANALINSAVEEMKDSNYYVAIQKIKIALSIDSINRNAYVNLNYACSQIHQYSLLIEYLERAKRIFLEDDEILYYTGNAYRKLNNMKEAISNYDSAIIYSKINGEDFPLVYAYYLNRGNCFVDQQDYDRALLDYTYALKLDKSKSSIYVNRGNTYLKLNMINEACEDWMKAYELGEKSIKKYIKKYCK